MTKEEQRTLNFCRNILGIIRSEYYYERAVSLINDKVPSNEFESAFKEGALYYCAFWWDRLSEYTFKPELKLKELTYMPGLAESAKYFDYDIFEEQRELAIPQWLEYNIVTEGCNSVC